MAYTESLRTISLNADSSLAGYTGVPGLPGSADPNGGKQFHFVKVTGAHECGLATDADLVVGVLQNKPQVEGAAATVAIDGVSMVQAGGTITAGEPVTVKSTGEAETADLTGLTPDTVVGIALAGAASGQLLPVLLKV